MTSFDGWPHDESSPRRFWIKGDVQLLSAPAETDAFFLFGTQRDSMAVVYAAGYSLQRRAILFGRVDLSDSSAAALEVLAIVLGGSVLAQSPSIPEPFVDATEQAGIILFGACTEI